MLPAMVLAYKSWTSLFSACTTSSLQTLSITRNIVHELNNCKTFQTRRIRYKISHCLYDWLKRSFFRGGKLSASSSCVFPSLSLVETGALQLWQCDFCETHRKRSGKEVITQLQISHSSNKSPLQPHLFIFHCFDVTTYLTISWTTYKTYSYK